MGEYYRELFGARSFFVELHNHLLPRPYRRMRHLLSDLAARLGIEAVATNNVHYVERSAYRLQDVMVCMDNLRTVEEPHPDRRPNAEFFLKSPEQMSELFVDQPEAIAATARIAERCSWELDLESFHFPAYDLDELRQHCRQHPGGCHQHYQRHPGDHYPPPRDGETTRGYLRRLCAHGARRLYRRVDGGVRSRLEHELAVIDDKGLCDYFLIVWDIVRFAREQRIRCSGRGSAGDSLVSYVLGITSVDPLAHDLLFERFLNPERRQHARH